MDLLTYRAEHVGWMVAQDIATITFNRPERKNPLSFESYAELLQLFRALASCAAIKAVILTGAGGNFCSGGDVETIIGPLTRMRPAHQLEFTRGTGALVAAICHCPQPVIAAIDGAAAGAGAILAMAADIRLGTSDCRISFLFTRVGLAGCDMGACALLPRIIGQGRASELLLTGRTLEGGEAERWGFLNRLVPPAALQNEARLLAAQFAAGPGFALSMTKAMLYREWVMDLDAALEAEAQAQALCMTTQDFGRAYKAFASKSRAVFQGD